MTHPDAAADNPYRAHSPLGIAAVAIGLIAFVLAFAPFLNLFLSLPMALLGLIVGGIGLARAAGRPGERGMLAGLGVALSVGAVLVVAVLWWLTPVGSEGVRAPESDRVVPEPLGQP